MNINFKRIIMSLFGIFSEKEATNEIKEYLSNGAVVLDVRTQEEWDEGHTEGAKHIVLQTIPANVDENLGAKIHMFSRCPFSRYKSYQFFEYQLQRPTRNVNGTRSRTTFTTI